MTQQERQAFNAMREAIYSWCAVIERCHDTYKLATDREAPDVMVAMRAALKQANAVNPRGDE